MGDVLMTGPAIRALKAGGGRITLLTSRSGAAAARLLPEVDEIIEYQSPWMKATGHGDAAAVDRALIEELRGKKFDGAVIFTVYSQNPLPAAMFCYLAEIPLRSAHCRENPYRLLTDWVPEPEPERKLRHEVRRQLDLVAAVGFEAADERMRISISPSAKRSVVQALDKLGVDADLRNWVVIHPGATAESRRYPPAKFAEVSRILVEEFSLQAVFTGTAEEMPLVESIRREMANLDASSLAGKLDFEQLAALVSIAPVLISNNSSPVHLASATGTPVVDLYALTNPQHTPWGVPSRVLFADVPCRFCYKSICPEGHHACLEAVEPRAVVRAALELLEKTEAGGPACESVTVPMAADVNEYAYFGNKCGLPRFGGVPCQ